MVTVTVTVTVKVIVKQHYSSNATSNNTRVFGGLGSWSENTMMHFKHRVSTSQLGLPDSACGDSAFGDSTCGDSACGETLYNKRLILISSRSSSQINERSDGPCSWPCKYWSASFCASHARARTDIVAAGCAQGRFGPNQDHQVVARTAFHQIPHQSVNDQMALAVGLINIGLPPTKAQVQMSSRVPRYSCRPH